ncbi:hypothetical protein HanPSC8_Chr13g0545531 [Helianthus annuus]|nr:hypothetical protein HanPSC8_Chr13g0545531 [Helianthus annuus]
MIREWDEINRLIYISRCMNMLRLIRKIETSHKHKLVRPIVYIEINFKERSASDDVC